MDFRKELTEHILPFWQRRMCAPDGGFHGRIDGEGTLHEDADRGGILNARILWTFAASYRVLGDAQYLEIAQKAKRVLLEQFLDPEFGGTYWSITSEGAPKDTKKQIYSIAFTIYALSELVRATGDKEALEAAKGLFEAIESHSLDALEGGYLEAFSRDWGPLHDMRLSEKDQNDAKTMNTHLHVLEGYTNLLRVWRYERLERQLKNLVEVFLEHIVLPDGHLALFFDEHWRNTSHALSFGHDIEASWLLDEAADVIGDQALKERVSKACEAIAVAALEGWTPEGGMNYEKDLIDGKTDCERHWWVQAETVVGCMWQGRRTEDPFWRRSAEATASFIESNLISPEGEWWWSVLPDGSPNRRDDLAGFWKCPYHNGRMCLEMIESFGNNC